MNKGVYRDLYCIAGSGERLISLLNHRALKQVHIIDNNSEALFLTELKLTALKHLSVKNYLEFIGFIEGTSDRIKAFEKLRSLLSAQCRTFWQYHLDLIRGGVLYCGQFERFLARIRPVLRIYLGDNFYKHNDSALEHIGPFPEKKWNLLRWIFSKRWAYRLAGNNDLAFISDTADQQIIPNGLHQTIKDNSAGKNCMFHLIFNGNLHSMNEMYLPVSFQRKELEQIKKALVTESFQVTFHEQDLLSFAKQNKVNDKHGAFFSISDILSFENKPYLKAFLGSLQSKNRCTVIFRSFLSHRMNAADLTELEKYCQSITDHSDSERTNMYQVIESVMSL